MLEAAEVADLVVKVVGDKDTGAVMAAVMAKVDMAAVMTVTEDMITTAAVMVDTVVTITVDMEVIIFGHGNIYVQIKFEQK